MILVTYSDISLEEAEELHTMSRGERQVTIERGMKIYED